MKRPLLPILALLALVLSACAAETAVQNGARGKRRAAAFTVYRAPT